MSPTEFTHSPVIPIAAPFDLTDYPELAGIEAITGTGLVARTGTGTYATRTIAVPAAGITISNAGGVAGNPTLALANDLAALEALSSTGIAVRSTTDTWVQRTITGTTNQVNVSNGDGVSGNPTLSTPQNIHTGATPQFAGIGLGTAYSSGRIQLVSGTTSADGIFWGTDTNLYRSAANTLKTDDALTVAATTASTSSTTGALIVSGGAGFAGALNVSDYIRISTGAVYASEKLTVRATGSALYSAAVWQSGSNTLHHYLYSDNNLAGAVSVSTSGGAIYVQQHARDGHRFMNNSSEESVRITNTAGSNRYITLTGSNGGNPTIDVSAGSLAITPATVFASTVSALAITGNSFIPNAATVPTNGMYLEAANNPAFAANSTKVFEYDANGIQIAGTITTLGGATFHTTSTALTDGVGAGAGTITNAPAAGNPSKWIGINDNGTTRYIPAW